MPDPADEIFNEFLDRLEEVTEELCQDVAEDLRREVGIPVDRSTRPPTRSLPGQYPRKDSGRFQGSITYVVYRAGGNVKGVVATATPYDVYLNATRPFKRLIESKWQRLAEQRYELAFR